MWRNFQREIYFSLKEREINRSTNNFAGNLSFFVDYFTIENIELIEIIEISDYCIFHDQNRMKQHFNYSIIK